MCRPTLLAAQGADRAVESWGIAVGITPGFALWDIPAQTLKSVFDDDAVVHLHRDVSQAIAFGVRGQRFVSPHLAVALNADLIGTSFADRCIMVQDKGDVSLRELCSALDGERSPGTITTMQAGILFVPISGHALLPFASVLAGVAVTPTSTIATSSAVDGQTLEVYIDHGWQRIRPTATLAIGAATAPARGLQLRAEVRQAWWRWPVVDGAAPTQGSGPPTRQTWARLTTISFGASIVFTKVRGRRY